MRAVLLLMIVLWSAGTGAAPLLSICYGAGCVKTAALPLDEAQWRQVAKLFEPYPESAAEERVRIARAIATLERLSGELSGVTHLDRGGNSVGAGQPGQLDCRDESINTTTYLRILKREGLLYHHNVLERRMREHVAGIGAHWTAVLEERESGARFAVDSWFRDNGEEPIIIPLQQWLDFDEEIEPPPIEIEGW
ncbi:hypothetical protein [Endothiovibrio diazotrophicus]